MVFLFLVSRMKINFQRFGITTAITNSSDMYTTLQRKGARFAQVRGKDTEKERGSRLGVSLFYSFQYSHFQNPIF